MKPTCDICGRDVQHETCPVCETLGFENDGAYMDDEKEVNVI